MCIFSAGHLHTIHKIHEEENRTGENNSIPGSHMMMKTVQNTAALIVILLLVVSCSVGKQGPLLTKFEESGYAHLTSSAEISMFLTELSTRNATAEKATIATSVLGSPVDILGDRSF